MTDHKEELKLLKDQAHALSEDDDDHFILVFSEAQRILNLSNSSLAETLRVSQDQLKKWLHNEEPVPPAFRSTIFHWIEREASKRFHQSQK